MNAFVNYIIPTVITSITSYMIYALLYNAEQIKSYGIYAMTVVLIASIVQIGIAFYQGAGFKSVRSFSRSLS